MLSIFIIMKLYCALKTFGFTIHCKYIFLTILLDLQLSSPAEDRELLYDKPIPIM